MRAGMRLPVSLESAAAARRFTDDTLVSWGVGPPWSETARLLVTELVTNAVLHAATPAELVVDLSDGRLRIEVRDDEGRRPVVGRPGPDDVHGRGLVIVDAMADRWGVDEAPIGKTVWFELDQEPSAGHG
jgi:anti-sigma regulatory factor (Ser/Thr protein kinase)